MDQAKFMLDLRDERLLNGSQPVQLTNKAFQLLRYLVQNPNRLLTKEAILEDLWPGIHVSEALIKEYIRVLRAALGDDSKRPKFIETVHGRGYRFHGNIQEVNSGEGATGKCKRRTGPPSMAVLPLLVLASGEQWERFCHGVCDDLITDLTCNPDLRVIAKSSSFAYPGGNIDVRAVGRDLGADYLLEGSMQVSEDQFQMNLQLVETQNGHNIWARRYERSKGDLLALQRDIATRAATSISGFKGQITRAERLGLDQKSPRELDAYELYLLGCDLVERFEKQSVLRAFELLMRSVELDPHFARAWLVLSWTCFYIASERWCHDVRRYEAIEREACIKAAALDPRDPMAQMELACLRVKEGDLGAGIDGLEQAVDLGRNQAELLAMIGIYVAMVIDDSARAIQIMNKRLELSSQAPNWYFTNLARVAYFAGEFERAVGAARRGTDTQHTRLFELLSIAQLDRVDELREISRSFELRYPNFDVTRIMRDPPIVGARAKALFLDGMRKAGLS